MYNLYCTYFFFVFCTCFFVSLNLFLYFAVFFSIGSFIYHKTRAEMCTKWIPTWAGWRPPVDELGSPQKQLSEICFRGDSSSSKQRYYVQT